MSFLLLAAAKVKLWTAILGFIALFLFRAHRITDTRGH